MVYRVWMENIIIKAIGTMKDPFFANDLVEPLLKMTGKNYNHQLISSYLPRIVEKRNIGLKRRKGKWSKLSNSLIWEYYHE